MNWKASPPAIEIAVEWIAAACLGGAVGFAVARIAPFGAGLVVSGVAGAVAALAAWLILGRVDRQRGSRRQQHAPVNSPSDFLTEDVLLLDQPVDHDDVLLLDDPLPAVDHDSRVVRLFAAHSVGTAASAPLAGPGEMVARIENFLGHARDSATAAEPAHLANKAASDDASAALHAALADIRRSLRQG